MPEVAADIFEMGSEKAFFVVGPETGRPGSISIL